MRLHITTVCLIVLLSMISGHVARSEVEVILDDLLIQTYAADISVVGMTTVDRAGSDRFLLGFSEYQPNYYSFYFVNCRLDGSFINFGQAGYSLGGWGKFGAGASDHGTFAFAWPDTGVIYASLFDSTGSDISFKFQVSPNFGYVAATMDMNSGGYFVVYQLRHARTYDPSGNPLTDWIEVLDEGSHGGAVSMDDDGNFICAAWQYTGDMPSEHNVFYSKHSLYGDSLFLPRTLKLFPDTNSTAFAASPLSAVLFNSGQFVIGWGDVREGGLPLTAYGQYFDSDGSKIGNDFRISSMDSVQVSRCAADQNIEIPMFAYTRESSDMNAYARAFGEEGAPLHTEFKISNHTDSSYASDVDVHGDTAYFCWFDRRIDDMISVYAKVIRFSYLSICGDADGSGAVDIDDVVYLISYIFSGGPAPFPLESGDADCAGGVDIDDVVYLISYIFSGGHAPCDPNGDDIPDC